MKYAFKCSVFIPPSGGTELLQSMKQLLATCSFLVHLRPDLHSLMGFRDEGCGVLKKSQEVLCYFAAFCCICHYEFEEMSIAMSILHIWFVLL